jgi:hypothetical protein
MRQKRNERDIEGTIRGKSSPEVETRGSHPLFLIQWRGIRICMDADLHVRQRHDLERGKFGE